MDARNRIAVLTGENDLELINVVLEDAQEFVLSYTNRTKMIPQLEKPVRDLAVIALNRMGTEGETGRSAAGETYSFDVAPKHIYDVLDKYRLVRIGGKVYEAEKKAADQCISQENENGEG